MTADKKSHKPATRALHTGGQGRAPFGVVNPPVVRGSSVLFASMAERDAVERKVFGAGDRLPHYGRNGHATQWSLEDALADMEGGQVLLAPSGVGAISLALLSVLSPGDHLLMIDSAYGPSRKMCEGMLKRMNVRTTYYDPLIGAGIADLIEPDTRAIFCESPGSLTFEVQDIPAIVQAAHARGVLVMMDNTWATPRGFDALGHGVDISIQSLTKYVSGHADVMMGCVAANGEVFEALKATHRQLGLHVSPDDAWLMLRGLRTLDIRLKQHEANARVVAEWLAGRDEVARVLWPGLPSDPGHDLWKRDFTLACGLMGAEMATPDDTAMAAMVDGFELIGLGYSWGGYESVCMPAHAGKLRSVSAGRFRDPLFRLHVGLEDPADVIADLEAGLVRYRAALGG